MFGQLAELPPWCGPGAGAGAGVVPLDPESDGVDELLEELLDEPSLWAQAAAPLPSMSPAKPAAAIACLSRRVEMSFTPFRGLWRHRA
jgi:hypothetical protein